MSYPLPLTRTEAYLAYKAGVIQQSELKPSLAVPRIGIDAWLAYWTELTNDYPKNPDGTPMILQEEEAYIAYLCGVLDTYPEKCLRRVGAYLRYIISARWGRPDHPLNREELYLSLIKTQFIPSGDPSSDIEIDGTAKAEFVDIKMYGDTFQQSYSGKNLLKFVPSTAGLNGLTVNYDEDSGVVRVSGTPTQNWSNIDSTTKNMSLKAGSYTLSVDNPSPLYRMNFRIYDPTASGGYIDFHGTDGGNVAKFTLDHDINDVVMRVYIDHNYDMTSVDWSFKIMLESGSEITLPYEPYVGGTPSPSPEYPQPIQTVTGLQTVEVQGKNLFDKSTEESGWLNNTGGISQPTSTSDKTSAYIPATSNTAYTLSSPGYYLKIAQYDSSKTFIKLDTTGNNIPSNTITTEANTAYIRISYGNAQNQPNVMLERGSTASSYIPYSKHAYPINLGSIELCKLGDYQDYIWEDMGEWKVHKETGEFVFTEETTPTTGRSKNGNIGFVIDANNNPLPNKHIPLIGACSHFGTEDTTTTWTGINRTGMNSSGALWFQTGDGNNPDTRTITQFFEWLAASNITYNYALAIPTDTVITDQNLISQLNALKKGGSEDGTTYIKVSATDPNLPAKLYVEAAKYV